MAKDDDQTADLEVVEQGGDSEVSVAALSGQLFDIPDEYLDEADKTGGAAPPATELDPAPADPRDKGKPGTQLRDDSGRFAPKAEDEPPAAGKPGQPPAKPAAAPGKPAAEGGDEREEAAPVPLTFTADQKKHEIPGSRVTPEGAFIPRDQLPGLQRKLSRGTIYESSFRQLISERDTRIHELETRLETDEDKVKAKAFLTHFAKLLDEGPEAIERWLADFDRNRVKLEADATLAQARALTEGGKKKPAETRLPGLEEGAGDTEPDPLEGVDQDELQDTLSQLLQENLTKITAEAGLTTLTAADLARLHTRLSDPDELGRFFVYAMEDIPELKAKRGDILVKAKALRKELETYADLVGQGRGVRSAADIARDKNTRGGGAGGGRNAPPPTSATSGGSAAKQAVPKLPKTREQKDEWDKLPDDVQDASIKQGIYATAGEKLVG